MTTSALVPDRPAGFSLDHIRPTPAIAVPVLLILFGVTIILSVATVRWAVGGIPVRLMFAALLAGLLLLLEPRAPLALLRNHARAVLVICLFAVLGFGVSLANAAPLAGVAQQIAEIHVQALLGIFVGSALIRATSAKAVCTVFLIAIGLSVVVAAAQFFGTEIAWSARRLLGLLNKDGPLTQLFYIRQDRPMGLSYSPVHLGTQACLAFAAYFILRARDPDFMARMRWSVVLGLVLVALACTVSGNRSPLLGIFAFSFIYLALVNRLLFLIACAMVVVIVPSWQAIQDLLLQAGLRIAETGDGSSEGRFTLSNYGWRLFVDRPTGYGLLFNSTYYWSEYWEYIQYSANSQVVKNFTLHNYFLQILNKYGIGAAFIALLVVPLNRRDWLVCLAFLPYILHIAFHNDGPLQADFLFWYILPLGVMIRSRGLPGSAPMARWRRYLPESGRPSTVGS